MDKELFDKIAAMDTAQIAEAVKAEEITVDDVKAYSEELEAQNKTSLDEKAEQILNDRLGKIDKLRAKAQKTVEEPKKEEAPKLSETDVDDLITLREQGFDKDSEEAKILAQYKEAGLIEDYKSGLNDPGVKAKLDAIKAEREAAAEADKNADEDAILQTKQTILNEYQEKGEEPTDEYSKQVIVEKELEQIAEVPLD